MLMVIEQADADDDTEVTIIYNKADCPTKNSGGVLTIANFLKGNWNIKDGNIDYRGYVGSSGMGQPNPGRPNGLAAIRVEFLASLVCQTSLTTLQWLKPEPGDQTSGKIQTYFNSDTPIRDQTFD